MGRFSCNILLLSIFAILLVLVIPTQAQRRCHPMGCKGVVIIRNGRRYRRISRAFCQGSCPRFFGCKGTARCRYFRSRRRRDITIVRARPVGDCECKCKSSPSKCFPRPVPSNVVRPVNVGDRQENLSKRQIHIKKLRDFNNL